MAAHGWTAALVGLAVAGGCTRPNPAFYPEVTDGPPAPDLTGAESPRANAGPDVNVAADPGPDGPGTEAAPDLPPSAPPAVQVGAPNARTWQGGGGGVEFLIDRCPDGQVVIGHQGADSDETTFVGRLQIQCGSLRVTRTAPPFTIEVTPGTLLPARGKTTGVRWSALCPANHVVVRYAGQAASYIESLRTTCAQLEVTADRSGIRFATLVDLPAHGSGPAPAFEESCDLLGQVALGADTRAGGWLDAIRPVCAPIIVVP